MDALPPMFSGTLKVQTCYIFWTKTPVQLVYYRQDYRHALPVLLVRRTSAFGGEFHIPLDPCIHPVRLLSMTAKMASKLEFVLEYGWHTKQVRLRAPNVSIYRQWMSLMRDALESGRKPLALCTVERPQQDLESSFTSTVNSSNNGILRSSATVQQRVAEIEEDDEATLQRPHKHNIVPLHQTPKARQSVEDLTLVSPSSAAMDSRSCERQQRCAYPQQEHRCFSPSRNSRYDKMIIVLCLTSFWCFLL